MTPALTTDAEPGSAPATGAAPRRGFWTRRRWVYFAAGAGTLLIVAAAAFTAADIEAAAGSGLLRLVRVIGQDLLHLRWQFTLIVVALAAVHYLVTAVAARAAANVPLPMGETVLVQLAAAAANRLTPAGLGGSAVNTRYFSRRGLTVPVALGAVVCLSVIGSLSDLIVLAIIVLLGRWIWLDGASNQVGQLIDKVTGLTSPLRSIWTWCAVVVLIGVIAALFVRRSRRGAGWPKWQTFWTPLARLGRRPRALATLVLASGCTTLVLAFAFVATTAMVPGPRPDVALGALLVAFMLGSAAGSAVPIPAGLGSTETALVGVLVAMDVPSSQAVQEVLIFRLLTFWLPAVVGVLATRYLYRRGAL